MAFYLLHNYMDFIEESERKENKAEKIANLIITIEILVLATIIGVISFYALDKVNVSNNVHWIFSLISGPFLAVLGFLGNHFKIFDLNPYLELQKKKIKVFLYKS